MNRWTKLCVLLAAMMPIGCMMQPADTGTTDTLEDADGNGFPEIEAPAGVDTSTTIAIDVVNELTQDSLVSLLAGADTGLEGLVGLVQIDLEFEMILRYENGEEAVVNEKRELGPFTIRFEAPCPIEIETVVSVTASAPFVGTILDETLPAVILTQEASPGSLGVFECDKIVTLTSLLSDAGQPDIEFSVDDF